MFSLVFGTFKQSTASPTAKTPKSKKSKMYLVPSRNTSFSKALSAQGRQAQRSRYRGGLSDVIGAFASLGASLMHNTNPLTRIAMHAHVRLCIRSWHPRAQDSNNAYDDG